LSLRRLLREGSIGVALTLISILVVLAAAEVVLRLRGNGAPERWFLPQVVDGRPIVQTVRYDPSPRLPLRLAPASFPARKPDGAIRILCLGDSTVFGYPYAPRVTPPRLLEMILTAALPARQVEVINAGFLGGDSSRVLSLMHELFDTEPDACVVYAGHNEFLRYDQAHQFDVRFDFNPKLRLPLRARAFVTMHRSALWRWACGTDLGLSVRNWWHRVRTGRRIGRSGRVSGELEDLTFRSFEANLVDMASECRSRGVALVISTPAGNSRSREPLFRFHGRSIGADTIRRVNRDLAAATASIDAGSPLEAVELAGAASRLDPVDAQPEFVLGRAFLAAGEIDAAREAFERAVRKDGMRHRAVSRIGETARAVAHREEGVVLCDVRAAFERESPYGIIGEELIVDHVHPNLDGAALLARLWAKALAEAGIVPVEAIEGLPLTNQDLITRLGMDLSDRRNAMLRTAVSAVGQVNPVQAASLFRIAATLYAPDDPEMAVGPVYLRGVAALVQGNLPEARRLLYEVRDRDPSFYERGSSGRFEYEGERQGT
jgi:lysophospholipase L1-like esterase